MELAHGTHLTKPVARLGDSRSDLAKLQTCFVGVGFFRTLDFYATYPGLYMPRSPHIGCDRIEQTPTYLAAEIFLP